jgi:ABC-2 type transport system permease protein
MLHVYVPLRSFPSLALVVGVTAVACTGFGFLGGAIGLRVRDVIILINMLDAVLLIFCGVNVPLDKLPHWMHVAAEGLPVTHAVAASREVASGASLASVRTPLLVEVALGFVYLIVGFALLRLFEEQGRRHGTLDRA